MEKSLHRIRDHATELVSNMRGVLRDVIQDACDAISAAEGSILVPTTGRDELRFLVSLNPALDESDYKFPCDGSVSGFVFNSSQAIAKIRPENDAVNKVDDIAKVDTEFLLAIPIVDDERIYGVATFVNRSGEFTETPFSAKDMKTAQEFGEIYASALKFYQQIELSVALAKSDIAENAADLGFCSLAEDGTSLCDEGREELRDSARIAEVMTSLEPRERKLLLGVAGLISHHSLTDLDLPEDEF